ncbi:MAG: M48 family metallopeptidase [Caulobacterales bacterium]|nr:M48 family metallopeptidase [Caulobacterales bacterium]
MAVRFFDGRTARAHEAGATVDGDALRILADGREIVWPVRDLDVEVEAGEARVSSRREPDARLVLPADEWRTLVGSRLDDRRRTRRRREMWLVGGLIAMAAAVVLFVTVGVPALSGPLARATPVSMERRMGVNFEAQISAVFPACEEPAAQAVLDRLGRRLAVGADSAFDIRVRAVDAPLVNAFALPGGAILVTDDLIRDAESPDELAAVIAHEVAHVEKRHVMQGVWRDLGAGMLLDLVVGGGTGAGQQAVLLGGQLTSLRHDRAAEMEADARGQALLRQAGLSSQGMAPFFARLSRAGGGGRLEEATEFINSHPASSRRVRAAEAAGRPGAPALTEAEWRTVRAACAAGSDGPVDRLRRRLGLGDDPALTDQGDQVGPDGQGGRRP